MRIINRTVWRTDQLKTILQRAAELEFDDGKRRKELIVTVEYTRGGGCSGYGFYHGKRSLVRIANPNGIVSSTAQVPISDPRPALNCHGTAPGFKIVRTKKPAVDTQDTAAMAALKKHFAHVACHEFAHNRGMHHAQMPGYYRWHGNWEPYVAWAADMPLEVKPVKAKPTTTMVTEAKYAHAQAMLANAETRAKRANTILTKWRRKVRYHEQRLAAARPNRGET